MSTRKYESGHSKKLKRIRRETLIESQKGSLLKFVTVTKNDKHDNMGEPSLNEENDFINIGETEILEEEPILDNLQSGENIETRDIEEEENNELPNSIPENIYDPSQWNNIDTKLRDLLVERGPVKISDIDFPKDEYSRHFAPSLYMQ